MELVEINDGKKMVERNLMITQSECKLTNSTQIFLYLLSPVGCRELESTTIELLITLLAHEFV